MSLRRFRSIALGLVIAMVAGEALAGEKGSKGKGKGKKSKARDEGSASYQPPYGMAGCGLGSIIFKSDTPFPQILAVYFNGLGSQTSAISCSQSSNCAKTPAEVAAQEQKVFITANRTSLEKDVSSGGGQFAQAFAQVLGCYDSAAYDHLLTVSRANYSRIFTNVDAGQVYDQYMQVLRGDEILANGCERVAIKEL